MTTPLPHFNSKIPPLQIKVFSRWASSVLRKRGIVVKDATTQFTTGVNLVNLAEVLTGETKHQGWTRNPTKPFQKVENCDVALKLFIENGVNIVNCTSKDITDGNVKCTMELLWTLILKYTIEPVAGVPADTKKLNTVWKAYMRTAQAAAGTPESALLVAFRMVLITEKVSASVPPRTRVTPLAMPMTSAAPHSPAAPSSNALAMLFKVMPFSLKMTPMIPAASPTTKKIDAISGMEYPSFTTPTTNQTMQIAKTNSTRASPRVIRLSEISTFSARRKYSSLSYARDAVGSFLIRNA